MKSQGQPISGPARPLSTQAFINPEKGQQQNFDHPPLQNYVDAYQNNFDHRQFNNFYAQQQYTQINPENMNNSDNYTLTNRHPYHEYQRHYNQQDFQMEMNQYPQVFSAPIIDHRQQYFHQPQENEKRGLPVGYNYYQNQGYDPRQYNYYDNNQQAQFCNQPTNNNQVGVSEELQDDIVSPRYQPDFLPNQYFPYNQDQFENQKKNQINQQNYPYFNNVYDGHQQDIYNQNYMNIQNNFSRGQFFKPNQQNDQLSDSQDKQEKWNGQKLQETVIATSTTVSKSKKDEKKGFYNFEDQQTTNNFYQHNCFEERNENDYKEYPNGQNMKQKLNQEGGAYINQKVYNQSDKNQDSIYDGQKKLALKPQKTEEKIPEQKDSSSESRKNSLRRQEEKQKLEDGSTQQKSKTISIPRLYPHHYHLHNQTECPVVLQSQSNLKDQIQKLQSVQQKYNQLILEMLKIKLGTDPQTLENVPADPMKEVYEKLSQISVLNKDKKQEDLTKEMTQMMENDKDLGDHLENVMLETWLVRIDINSALGDMRQALILNYIHQQRSQNIVRQNHKYLANRK